MEDSTTFARVSNPPDVESSGPAQEASTLAAAPNGAAIKNSLMSNAPVPHIECVQQRLNVTIESAGGANSL